MVPYWKLSVRPASVAGDAPRDRTRGSRVVAALRTDMRIRDRSGRWQLLWADRGVGKHTRLHSSHELVVDHPEEFEFVEVGGQTNQYRDGPAPALIEGR